MWNWKKRMALLSPLMALLALFVCQTVVMAATLEKQAVTIQLSGFDGEPGELRIGADEKLNDNKGNLLLNEGEEIQTSFSKDGSLCISAAELYKGVRYYISDGVNQITFVPESTVCKVSFQSAGRASSESAAGSQNGDMSDEEGAETASAEGNASSEGLGIKTKSPKAVNEGDLLKCTVSALSGASDTESDTFLLQCDVPKGTVLESVYTGSYNADIKLDLICKTEKDGQWHTWGEGISSAKGETFKTDTISFAQGDRICQFAISASEAPKGFSLKEDDPCFYYVKIVDKGGAENYRGLTKVTAYLNGNKSASESSFTTLIQKQVQTGDSNVIFIGSFILLCVAVIVLVSYIICRVVFYRKEKTAAGQKLPVKYTEGKPQGTQGKMSDLLQKKPG